MISGHGIDIVELNRFRKMGDTKLTRLAMRSCTDSELEEFANHKLKFQYLAKIWAGKEAISKAFGTGIRNDVTWKNIKISSDTHGKPSVWLQERLAGPTCHLSFSHEQHYLIASAILEV
jgi:holo-[acyl-carrier protein] synthase